METVTAAPAPEQTPPSPERHGAALTPGAALGRRVSASGTGLAIAIEGDALAILLVRVRPSRVELVAYQRFTGVLDRPAAEVGAEYARFLRTNGLAHLPAHVLLPREEMIVRTLSLPGVREKDLESAIGLQMESLHPYAEQAVSYGFTRLGKSPAVLVGICREQVVDKWITFFEEAGIKLASFTFSADVIYRALRSLRVPPPAFLCALEGEESVEIYGESPARPLYNAFLYAHAAQAAVHAQSELRLEEAAPVLRVEELLPVPASLEQEGLVREHPLLYATALAGAGFLPMPMANLLPAEYRKGSNWAILIPTLALAMLVLLLVGGSVAQQAWYERQYRERLDGEITKLQNRVAEGARLDAQGERLLTRLDLLRNYKLRSRQDLDALLAVTNLLPDTVWVTQAELNRGQVMFTGEAAKAGELIRLLDDSPHFAGTEFAMPLQRNNDRELFRVRARREYAAAEAAAPAEAKP